VKDTDVKLLDRDGHTKRQREKDRDRGGETETQNDKQIQQENT
jgi:hypothetical protein